ncbi:MAG: enoyl-CoA hydratase/isomerase family protein [Bacteriovoracaceae bacterium]|jgi:enoyl-CoA hydratase|nr:enoyl-CoA hydratase/isomerase family protein [Bacteriovoracaceae bacterium]
MESTSTLKVNIQDSVLTITINRPDKLNALSETVLTELRSILAQANEQPLSELRGVIITGEGEKAFIAGADIKAMLTMTPDDSMRFGKLGQDVTLLFESLTVPVIACINGFALGGGLEMAMSCDFMYCTPNAVFGQPEVKIGLIPGFGGTQRLSRYIGVAKCRELVYTGKNILAEEAITLGLVNQCFETKEEMLLGAMKTINSIKRNSPLAVSKCKQLVNEGECLAIEKGLALERNGFKDIFQTEDAKEGLTSFLEKRAPNYQGQ